MAKKSTKNGSNGTEIVKWEEQLAAQAETAAKQEANTGGGNFISTEGGTMTVNDAPVPNNVLGAVIVDAITVNAFYAHVYNPENKSPPICYALGRDDDTIAPHPDSAKPQADFCKDCEHNEFATSDTGRGKACKNTRRLAVIAGGTYDETGHKFTKFDEATLARQERYYLSVPPTSIGGFASYVKQLGAAVRRPPWGMYTKISLVKFKTFHKQTFEPVAPIDGELIPLMIKRHDGEAKQIAFPWPKDDGEDKKAKGKAGKRSRY